MRCAECKLFWRIWWWVRSLRTVTIVWHTKWCFETLWNVIGRSTYPHWFLHFRLKSIRLSCSRTAIISNRKTSQMRKEHHHQSEKNNHATVNRTCEGSPVPLDHKTANTMHLREMQQRKAHLAREHDGVRPLFACNIHLHIYIYIIYIYIYTLHHVLRSVIQLSYQAPPNKSQQLQMYSSASCMGNLMPKTKTKADWEACIPSSQKAIQSIQQYALSNPGTTVLDSWQGYQEPLHSQYIYIYIIYLYNVGGTWGEVESKVLTNNMDCPQKHIVVVGSCFTSSTDFPWSSLVLLPSSWRFLTPWHP